MSGGCTELWSNLSAEAEVFAVRHTYGPKADYKSSGRECIDYANSRLIVMWGWSPGDGHYGTSTFEYLKWARRNGTRIVCVDPRVTHTSLQLADEHMPIRPSTDTAMLIAMAYVVVTEGLHDTEFCDRLVLGLDEAHLPPGSPPPRILVALLSAGAVGRRAEDSGMGGADHRRACRDDPPASHRVRTVKPAAMHCGYAPGRTLYGE
jgi:anaerobic dimethyl sulfoxide reductase subunit A